MIFWILIIFNLKATLENDKVTERQISRIALLNVALYCGSLERARDLYDSSNFEKEEMDKAMMQGKLDLFSVIMDFLTPTPSEEIHEYL